MVEGVCLCLLFVCFGWIDLVYFDCQFVRSSEMRGEAVVVVFFCFLFLYFFVQEIRFSPI